MQSQLPPLFPFPALGPEPQGRVPPCSSYSGDIVSPEMKEKPKTGLGLFKFFCVGFGEGGNINFIGVGQDLGHKMPICLVLAVPLVHSALSRECVAACGRACASPFATTSLDRVFANSLSHLGHSERLPV